MTGAGDATLRVQEVWKRFANHVVLRGVGFQVGAGEVLGLLGGNGAGKSTTVRIIAGIVPPDAGVVTVADGEAPLDGRRRLGVALQEPAVYPALTCEENLRFAGRLYGLSGAGLHARVTQTLAQTGLDQHRRTLAARLSGGWRHRLNLAAALVHEPSVLLLDEPTAGLDLEARSGVSRLLRDLRARGAAVLLTTHLLEEAEMLCDRVAILRQGRVAAQGTLEALRRLVPARELAAVECGDETALRARARALNLTIRDYADGRITLLLPEPTTVAELARRLGQVGLRSLALQAVGLRHVYHEVSREPPPAVRW